MSLAINGHWYATWYGPKIVNGLLVRHVSKAYLASFDAQGEVNRIKDELGVAGTLEYWPVGSKRSDIVQGNRPWRMAGP